jgi:O-antigen/teichoic acid export membrane protein
MLRWVRSSSEFVSLAVRMAMENGPAKGVVLSIGLTGLAAVASFGLLTALARSMPTSDFGVLAGWMNLLLFLAVVAVFGQETMFIRSWNEFVQRGEFERARGVLRFGLLMTLCGVVVVTAGLAVASWVLRLDQGLAIGLMLFLIAQTLCLFSSQTSRMTAGIAAGTVHREVTWRCLVLLCIAWSAYVHAPFTTVQFFYLAAGGLLLAVALQARSTIAALPARTKTAPAKVDGPIWLHRSFRMWSAALLEAASQYLDVVLIAFFLDARDVAIYFVCVKVAALFLMLGDAFGLYSTRHISALYFGPNARALQSMLKQLSLLMAALCLSSLVFVFVAGDLLLRVFGASYAVEHNVLVTLCIGTATAALGGPAAQILLLTGHEKAYIRTLGLVTVVRYLLIGGFAWSFGLSGAAFANAAALIVLTVALVWACRRFVGVDPSPLILLERQRG